MRREEADRAVAPVVAQVGAARGIRLVDLGGIEIENREQLDRRDPQLFQIRDLLDHALIGARMRDAGGRRLRETADVHLVDDGLAHAPVEGLVALPVVRLVDDDAALRGAHVVVRAACVAPPPQVTVGGAGVRVQDDLVAVEQVPMRQVRRSVHSIRVEGPGPQPAHVAVPELKRLVEFVVELDDLEWLQVRVMLEQQELDSGCMLAPHREVHPLGDGVGRILRLDLGPNFGRHCAHPSGLGGFASSTYPWFSSTTLPSGSASQTDRMPGMKAPMSSGPRLTWAPSPISASLESRSSTRKARCRQPWAGVPSLSAGGAVRFSAAGKSSR